MIFFWEVFELLLRFQIQQCPQSHGMIPLFLKTPLALHSYTVSEDSVK